MLVAQPPRYLHGLHVHGLRVRLISSNDRPQPGDVQGLLGGLVGGPSISLIPLRPVGFYEVGLYSDRACTPRPLPLLPWVPFLQQRDKYNGLATRTTTQRRTQLQQQHPLQQLFTYSNYNNYNSDKNCNDCGNYNTTTMITTTTNKANKDDSNYNDCGNHNDYKRLQELQPLQ